MKFSFKANKKELFYLFSILLLGILALLPYLNEMNTEQRVIDRCNAYIESHCIGNFIVPNFSIGVNDSIGNNRVVLNEN